MTFLISDFRFWIARTKWQQVCCLSVCGLLVALCLPVGAQEAKKIPRIGFLAGTEGPSIPAFQRGLKDIGYTEGKNILVEYRYYQGKDDLVPSFIAEFIRLKVDVIIVLTLSSIRAAQQMTKTIPIVMVAGVDPVATDLVDSLAQPGGNLTGVTRLFQQLSGKRLELYKEMIPTLSHVGVLVMAGGSANSIRSFKEYETAGRSLKIQLHPLEVTVPSPNFDVVFRKAITKPVGALVTTRGNVLVRYAKQIADLARKNRLPLMSEGTDFVEAGALASYSTDDAENFRRAAVYVDKILKGAKPANLPVEQPTKFELVINLKTAKQIGLPIPPQVLARADKVIK
jgi:putative tryptophan/tyrosine transport system substrate-binding protein